MAVLIEPGAAEARGTVTITEDTRDPTAKRAAAATRVVDDNFIMSHHTAGPGAYHAVLRITETL
jgi:hypothetical protein